MTFNLTEARLNEGLSIRALARELGIPENSIRRFERGDGLLRPANAKLVADRFGVQVTDLLPFEREAA
jgi:transcriptional regulator with XRE-family HTH domain